MWTSIVVIIGDKEKSWLFDTSVLVSYLQESIAQGVTLLEENLTEGEDSAQYKLVQSAAFILK